MDSLGLGRILIGYFVLVFLVISVFVMVIVYLVRRLEIGERLARRETILSIILLLVIIPIFLLIVIFVLATYKSPNIDTFLTVFATLPLILVVALPLYWRFKTREARNSVLFQVPVKASILFLATALLFPIGGLFNILMFIANLELPGLLVGLGQIAVGLLIGYGWLRPTWHISQEGIFWHWVFIKWEQVVDQEWKPHNEQEVVLRLRTKLWGLRIRNLNQPIPIAFERPLKAIIQKYTSGETTSYSLKKLT